MQNTLKHQYKNEDRMAALVEEFSNFNKSVISNKDHKFDELEQAKVGDVVTIEDSDIEPPPALGTSNGKNRYVFGLGKTGDKVTLLLDPERLLGTEDLNTMEEMVQENE